MPLDFMNERELDHIATRRAVKSFFKKQYPRLQALASMDLQGVSYNNTRVQTSGSNTAEDRAMRVIQAKDYLNLINQCINSLDEIDQKIFTSLAIKHMSGFQAQELTGYGGARLYDIYGQSCEQLAEMLALISDIDLRRYERN